MRKNVITLLFAAVFCLLWAVGGNAQRPPKPSTAAPTATTAPAANDEEQIAGGYTARKTNDKSVTAAVRKGLALKSKEMKTNYRLGKIEKAESQVVAGTNYRVCMSVYVPKKGKPRQTAIVSAVIFQDLKGVYQVTSWEEVTACE